MKGMSAVQIELGERSYPLLIGKGLLDHAGDLLRPYVRGSRAFIITDRNVETLYLTKLTDRLSAAGFSVRSFVVPASETSKSFAAAEGLLEAILEAGCDRHSFLVALGGGVVGDLTGFCASVLLRGIDFVQVPTTLLSQVDSSVGGKTAVNARAGKNLIGSFHQPRAVLIDTETLYTLDSRQMRAGYAEVAKYGLISDASFWKWLEENGRDVLALDDEACRFAIERSCRIKADVVAADEKEETGRRALLNLGHTFGHAFETESGMDGTILHGEGVAAGCIAAADLSVRLRLCGAETTERIRAHFQDTSLPVSVPAYPVPALLAHMDKDKKTLDGRLNFVLLKSIGAAVLIRDVDRRLVSETLQKMMEE